MATIGTRINETTGNKETIIFGITDLYLLIKVINGIRDKESFYNLTHEKIFIIDNIKFNDIFSDNIEIYNCVFEKRVDFSNSVFRKKVKLYKCIFESTAEFNNTTFKNLVDFYSCVFKKPQQFYKTDFNRVAIFSNAIFEQEAQFIYCTTTLLSYISFQSAKFKMGIDVARANFNCKVNFWDIQVEDKGLLEAINSGYYFSDFDLKWLKKNKNNKKELDKWTPASKKLRESLRFIKNNFHAENNQIEGLEFYKKEMDIYQKEITSSKKNTDTPSLKEDTKQKHCIAKVKNNTISIIKNIFSWIENKKENHTIFYHLCIFSLIIGILSAYLYWKSYWTFWIFFVLYFYMIGLEIKLKNVKNAIKNSNYIPYVLLLFSTFLPLLPIYNHFDYKNNDKVYNLVMDIKQFFNTYNISSFIDSDWALIIIYPIGFIALLLAISFDFRDRILLFLNKISNNFGTNWMAGVNFTIFIGLFTLLPIVWVIYFKYNYILYFDPSLKGIGNFLYNFGQIINITEWSDIKIYGEEITGWSYVWLFIGRIFIGYGYYQTIQAFRKYGKS